MVNKVGRTRAERGGERIKLYENQGELAVRLCKKDDAVKDIYQTLGNSKPVFCRLAGEEA